MKKIYLKKLLTKTTCMCLVSALLVGLCDVSGYAMDIEIDEFQGNTQVYNAVNDFMEGNYETLADVADSSSVNLMEDVERSSINKIFILAVAEDNVYLMRKILYKYCHCLNLNAILRCAVANLSEGCFYALLEAGADPFEKNENAVSLLLKANVSNSFYKKCAKKRMLNTLVCFAFDAITKTKSEGKIDEQFRSKFELFDIDGTKGLILSVNVDDCVDKNDHVTRSELFNPYCADVRFLLFQIFKNDDIDALRDFLAQPGNERRFLEARGFTGSPTFFDILRFPNSMRCLKFTILSFPDEIKLDEFYDDESPFILSLGCGLDILRLMEYHFDLNKLDDRQSKILRFKAIRMAFKSPVVGPQSLLDWIVDVKGIFKNDDELFNQLIIMKSPYLAHYYAEKREGSGPVLSSRALKVILASIHWKRRAFFHYLKKEGIMDLIYNLDSDRCNFFFTPNNSIFKFGMIQERSLLYQMIEYDIRSRNKVNLEKSLDMKIRYSFDLKNVLKILEDVLVTDKIKSEVKCEALDVMMRVCPSLLEVENLYEILDQALNSEKVDPDSFMMMFEKFISNANGRPDVILNLFKKSLTSKICLGLKNRIINIIRERTSLSPSDFSENLFNLAILNTGKCHFGEDFDIEALKWLKGDFTLDSSLLISALKNRHDNVADYLVEQNVDLKPAIEFVLKKDRACYCSSIFSKSSTTEKLGYLMRLAGDPWSGTQASIVKSITEYDNLDEVYSKLLEIMSSDCKNANKLCKKLIECLKCCGYDIDSKRAELLNVAPNKILFIQTCESWLPEGHRCKYDPLPLDILKFACENRNLKAALSIIKSFSSLKKNFGSVKGPALESLPADCSQEERQLFESEFNKIQ